MTPLARVAWLAAVVFATSGSRFVLRAEPAPVARRTLSPARVLQRYAVGLAKVKRPKLLVFQYTVEQLGYNDLEQAHRVYRSGLSERDEKIVVDGHVQEYPSIRIFRSRVDRYDIAAVSPRPGSYVFKYTGVLTGASGGDAYVFKTERAAASRFSVSEVEIDGRSFLPSVVRFRISGNGAHGSGELRFGRAQSYWLVRQATVSTRLRGGASAHERITWSNYQFPPSLPSSTFAPPRAAPAPVAEPTPVPTPAGAPLSPI